MKKNIVKFFSLLIATTFFVSCDESGDDVAPIVNVAKPTMTIDIPTAITVSEGDVIPFTLNLSAPVGEAFSFFIVMQTGSTAGALDSDVENTTVNTTFQKVITVPPFVTTYSGVINIYTDDLAEPTENLILSIGDSRTTAVTFVPSILNVTILNTVSDELKLDFFFDRTFTGSNGYTNTICNFSKGTPSTPAAERYDVDFIVYDANFNDLSVFDAQTGSCNESLTMKLSDYADGLYHITAYLYTNADLDTAILSSPLVSNGDFNIPITVDYLRAGSINKGTYTQEAVNFLTAASPVGSEYQVVDILISTVNGVRKFTIQDTQGNISASGKAALKAKKHAKRVK